MTRLADTLLSLERVLKHGGLGAPVFGASDIRCETLMVAMRDGVRIATDLHLPPKVPAPVIILRTPYGRASENGGLAGTLASFARRGYAVVAQDCRGTGASEPDRWDYYMYEEEDGIDCVAWVRAQTWCDGFISSFGGSYGGQTQWCMALHPAMTTIVPSFSGLGIAANTAHKYMFLNAYARVMGHGAEKVSVPMDEMEKHFEAETWAGGYFNDPLYPALPDALTARFPELAKLDAPAARRFLWSAYARLTGAERARFVSQATGTARVTNMDIEKLPNVFGQHISHDALTVPDPDPQALCRRIHAVPLMHTGWYDWCLNDAFATWHALRAAGRDARLLITPYAHSAPGYHAAPDTNPELLIPNSAPAMAAWILKWLEAVRGGAVDRWPAVTYYMMGANEWRSASDWPVPGAKPVALYFGPGNALTTHAPAQPSQPDQYVYDPLDPTPTVGGSIVSYLYRAGSVDVSAVQARADIVTYTSDVLTADLDVAGPIKVILFASSTARDTDFVARLTDVFPDGRAIQLQSGILRTRFRDIESPAFIEPGQVYRLEIDLWATANRFKAGHRLRIDVSSADFPKFDRNTNRAGEAGGPIPAQQSIYHDPDHASHVLLWTLPT